MFADRRNYLYWSFIFGLFLACRGSLRAEDSVPVDPNLLVVASDTHVGMYVPESESLFNVDYWKDSTLSSIAMRTGRRLIGKQKRFYHFCDQVVQMNPRPSHVVFLGDLCFRIGVVEDYQLVKKGLQKLDDAGIPWTTTMGNHDILPVFFSVFPEKQLEPEPLKGHLVRVVSLSSFDLLLIDSHQDKGVPIDDEHPGDGRISPEVRAWLQERIAEQDKNHRPYWVASHHPLFRWDDQLLKTFKESPSFLGYWYGHYHNLSYTDETPEGIRSFLFPSTAYTSEFEHPKIGYTLIRSDETGRKTTFEFKSLLEKNPKGNEVPIITVP